jgi:hypothetical protein
MPGTLATWEAEMRGLWFKTSPQKIIFETPRSISKIKQSKKVLWHG